MSYLVLARRWRPQTFAEIVGQEHVTRTLQNAIRAGRVAHAFLFTGVRGVGKTTAARVLAKALNCEHGPAPEPCNACVHCQEIANGSSLDVVEVDGASNTGVDDVRAIIENVRYHPAKCRFKIYIVDEVHMLSTSAFNALLKTLEEPPAHVKFIFATTDPHKVPATIQSRCQRYDFKRLPLRLVVRHLAEIAAREGLQLSEKALFLLARESEGSMRDAQSLLDQVIAFGGSIIADEEILDVLGLADRSFVVELAAALLERDARKVLEVVEQVHTRGYDLRRFVRDCVEHFRNVAVVQAGAADLLQEEMPAEELDHVRTQAQTASFLDVERIFRTLLHAEGELGRNPVPKLCLEVYLLRLAMTEPLTTLASLSEQLLRLSQGPASSGTYQGQLEPTAARSSRSSAPIAVASENVAVPPKGAAQGQADRVRPEPPTSARAGSEDSPAAANGEESWAAFLRFVEKRKRFIAAHLESALQVDFGSDSVRIVVPGGIHHQYLTHGSRKEELNALASEFFGRRFTVQVETRSSAEVNGKKNAGDTRIDLRRQVLEYPTVRRTMEILGAEVREVRPRKAGQEKGQS
ncbi:MAG: DNA polymerase III subunit gamma/tau [Candidatus Binatia bacterium]|nr:DNA polymerase III subunit gamma/tau [Candidatus Binatia bacterium]